LQAGLQPTITHTPSNRRFLCTVVFGTKGAIRDDMLIAILIITTASTIGYGVWLAGKLGLF